MKDTKSFRAWASAIVVGLFLAGTALAAGTYTNGMTVWTPSQFSGSEQLPLDTQLSGGRSPQTVAATVSGVSQFTLGTPCSAASATAGAASLTARCGQVTSESLTTANGSDYTLTLTNAAVTSQSVIVWSVSNGTNTREGIVPHRVQPTDNGRAVFLVRNDGSGALNGTIKINYFLVQ